MVKKLLTDHFLQNAPLKCPKICDLKNLQLDYQVDLKIHE